MPPSSRYLPARAHLDLSPDLYDVVEPARFPQHVVRYRNETAAATVGLETLTDAEWVAHFAAFEPLPGSLPTPLALRYHGHQFQSYNPDLGDGRGFLFAQLYDHDGRKRLLDLATKGSGRTPWSRQGDGRLTLKGGVREILAAEMLDALGVDTSKAFSLIETGESLARHDEPSPTRSSVLVRLSHSHLRIGTFQRLAYRDDTAGLEALVTHALKHYGALPDEPVTTPAAIALLHATVDRVARTGARWMAAGFVHGVLNTDNINITGESFDYGPWRFTPTFDLKFVAAYFDHYGLYAFGQQPTALAWNLARLGECLVPLADAEEIDRALATFSATLQSEFARALLERLGLRSCTPASDAAVVRAALNVLTATDVPIERLMFDWFGGEASAARAARSPLNQVYESAVFQDLRRAWTNQEPIDHAATAAPYFQRETPCTMTIDDVEALWAPIARDDDWSAFTTKLADIRELKAATRGPNRTGSAHSQTE